MPDLDGQLEIKGRLWLWSRALDECAMLFTLEDRTTSELNSGRPIERTQTFNDGCIEYSKSQPDYVPGTAKLSHRLEYCQISPMEFPSFTDCEQIKRYCRILSVIFFCQIFKKGNPDQDRVAANDRAFRNLHLEKILTSVFGNQDERTRFEQLRTACEDVRDEMIGHADGKAFQVQHGHPITRMKGVNSALEKIDFDYMKAVLRPLNDAIMRYAACL